MIERKSVMRSAGLGALALACAMAPVPVAAQDFCAVLKQVVEDAPNKFANIGKLDMQETFASSGPLEIMLPGASECSMAKIGDRFQYSGDMGGPGEANAIAAKNYLGEQILACYPDAPVTGDKQAPRAALQYSLPYSNATVGVQTYKGTHYGYVAISPP